MSLEDKLIDAVDKEDMKTVKSLLDSGADLHADNDRPLLYLIFLFKV